MSPSQPTGDTPQAAKDKATVLSVDAMGGDKGPATVVAGLWRFLSDTPDATAILHGRASELSPLIASHAHAGRVTIRDAEDIVSMSDKPSQVLRHGKATSMWSAIEAVRAGEASVCVSCGNTGALMAISMLRLRKADGVNRPAIACLWPSLNPQGFNIMLDAGADIRADEDDLLTYAMMGTSYARNGLGLARPRVGLMNVGTEEHKGRAELKVAHNLIARAAVIGEYDYVGFVEGNDLPSDRVDVIVTDGFTGNVALKTGEGTASLISTLMRRSLKQSVSAMIGAVFAKRALGKFSKQIDPRGVNGGVFLGLNKTVVKSHGSADEKGVAAALALAYRLGQTGFSEKLAARVATAAALAQDTSEDDATGEKQGQA